MKISRSGVSAFVLCLVAGASSAMARSDGSLIPSRTCVGLGCHDAAGGPFSPSVQIEGPAVVTPGSTNDYSIVVNDNAAARAGFFLDANAGTLIAGDGSVLFSGHLAHSTPRAFTSRRVAWTLRWRAPANPGNARLDVAALAANGFNMADQVTANLSITVAEPVVAAFSANPTQGTAPLLVTFTDRSTGGVAPLRFEWDFDDGETSTSRNPTHTFDAPGNHSVTLRVVDAADRSSTSSMTIRVDAPAVVAAFDANPLRGVAPLEVRFTNRSSGGVAPLSRQWDFGDGGMSTANNPTHTYEEPGSFTATLRITDADGTSDTASRTITVDAPALVARFDADPTDGIAPLDVQFTSRPAGGVPPYTFEWEFGDGSESTAANPRHTYTSPGDLVARLTVRDSEGTEASAMTPITVREDQTGRGALLRAVVLWASAVRTGGDEDEDRYDVTAPSADPFEIEFGVRLESNFSEREGGAQGWSIAVEVRECLALNSATTDRTVAAPIDADPPGRRDGGFEVTALVDPERNDGRHGVVSAVVLAFTEPVTLDPVGDELILRLRADLAPGAAEPCVIAPLDAPPWLIGAGQPVETSITVASSPVLPDVVRASVRTLVGEAKSFLRGDADDNGRLSITDTMAVLFYLFQGGHEPGCLDASDADDNGAVNLSDAIYLLNFVFRRGTRPPPPFGSCGPDPTPDRLGCAVVRSCP